MDYYKLKDFNNLSRFLNLDEQEKLKKHNNEIKLFGGFSDAEYKRALIDGDDFNITCLKVEYNKKYYSINHRDVLGAILNLGIKREVIGDIVINDDIYIFVCSDFKDYLIREISKIKNANVTLKEVKLENFTYIDNSIEKKLFVKSLRIDLLISQIYNLSRFDSKELFIRKLVKLNHAELTNPSHVIKVNDIISVRGFGRFKLSYLGGITKSNNLCIKINIYK